jgi:glycosyltransferase involved in cell wall biosynthesis
MKNKSTIISIIGVYYPGYKAGGILRTLINMVDNLSSNYNFYIITTDRDLDDIKPYDNIKIDEWNNVGMSKVFYLSPSNRNIKYISKILNCISYDLIFLNSFFEPLCIKTLIAYKLGLIKKSNVLIAPRGEFAWPSLSQKYIKKYIYIYLSIKLKFYTNIQWLASSIYEKDEIENTIKLNNKINVLIDLPSKVVLNLPKNEFNSKTKIIFLSRISEEKNLDFALKILANVKKEVIFDIYGPVSNQDYWVKCKFLINNLPSNIKVCYNGFIKSEDVVKIFSKYDLFFLPTKGENYGHVIAESLSVGTQVLISNKTPWQNLQEKSLGWSFSLEHESLFLDVINKLCDVDFYTKEISREYVKKKYFEYLNIVEQINLNTKIINKIINT